MLTWMAPCPSRPATASIMFPRQTLVNGWLVSTTDVCSSSARGDETCRFNRGCRTDKRMEFAYGPSVYPFLLSLTCRRHSSLTTLLEKISVVDRACGRIAPHPEIEPHNEETHALQRRQRDDHQYRPGNADGRAVSSLLVAGPALGRAAGAGLRACEGAGHERTACRL